MPMAERVRKGKRAIETACADRLHPRRPTEARRATAGKGWQGVQRGDGYDGCSDVATSAEATLRRSPPRTATAERATSRPLSQHHLPSGRAARLPVSVAMLEQVARSASARARATRQQHGMLFWTVSEGPSPSHEAAREAFRSGWHPCPHPCFPS